MLADSIKAFGLIPGLHATMAEAPGLLAAYKKVHEFFVNSSFAKDEIPVVWQTINVEHACHYCVPAHTGIARSMGVDDASIYTNHLANTPVDKAFEDLVWHKAEVAA